MSQKTTYLTDVYKGMTFFDVLCRHLREYPLMQPVDLIKLCYQAEFGGEHLIRDSNACLSYVKREYESMPVTDGSVPLCEILEPETGIARVNMAAMGRYGISPELLCDVFVESAQSNPRRGSVSGLSGRIGLCPDAIYASGPDWDADVFDAVWHQYRSEGITSDGNCLPLSHSSLYRDTYHPHYRVIRLDILYTKIGDGAIGRIEKAFDLR